MESFARCSTTTRQPTYCVSGSSCDESQSLDEGELNVSKTDTSKKVAAMAAMASKPKATAKPAAKEASSESCCEACCKEDGETRRQESGCEACCQEAGSQGCCKARRQEDGCEACCQEARSKSCCEACGEKDGEACCQEGSGQEVSIAVRCEVQRARSSTARPLAFSGSHLSLVRGIPSSPETSAAIPSSIAPQDRPRLPPRWRRH